MPEVESTTTEKKMESPSKGSPTKKEIDIATQALNHFAQGKRHLLVNDIPSAVNSLQEACRLLAEQYGELAPECGDAYFYYGRALLEMARLESGVLGNALDGVPQGEDVENSQVENPEKMTDDEKEMVSEKVGEALEEACKAWDNHVNRQGKPSDSVKAVNGKEEEASGEKEVKKESGNVDEGMELEVKSEEVVDPATREKVTEEKKACLKKNVEGGEDGRESKDGLVEDNAEKGEDTEVEAMDVEVDTEDKCEKEGEDAKDESKSKGAETEKTKGTEVESKTEGAKEESKTKGTKESETEGTEKESKTEGAEKESKTEGAEKESKTEGAKKESKTEGAEKESKTEVAEKESKTKGAEKESKTEGAEKESKTEGAEKESKTEGAEKESKTEGAEKESKTEGAEKESKTEGAEKESKTEGAEKESKTEGAEKESKTEGAEKESKTEGAEKESKAEGAEKESKEGGAEKESKAEGAEKESKASGAEKELKDGGAEKESKAEGAEKESKAEGAEKESKAGGAEKESKAKEETDGSEEKTKDKSNGNEVAVGGSNDKLNEKSESDRTDEKPKEEENKCTEKTKEESMETDDMDVDDAKPGENVEGKDVISEDKPKTAEEPIKESADCKSEVKEEETIKKDLKMANSKAVNGVAVTNGDLKKEGSTEGEDEDDNDGEEDNEDEDEEKSDSQSQEEGSQEEGEKTDEDEDVSNLQLAWEMLELAKCIFQKQTEGNPDMALKVAQVHLKLGELSLENESYAQSVEDLTRCLDIQKKILEPDNRCLAESHYQLGVAHSFSDEFDKAIESFNSSISVIEDRKVNLVKKIEEKKSWTEEQRTKDAAEKPDPFYTEQGEIDELNQLVPDIKEKVVDMEEMKKDSRERIAKITKPAEDNMGLGKVLGSPSSAGTSGTSSGTSSVGFGSTSAFGTSTEAKPVEAKPVSNIGHLIRKKTASECGGGPSNVAVGAVTAALLRKPEEEVGDTSKKSRAEDGTARNGLGSTSDTSNGVSIEKMESEQEKPRSTSAVEEPKKEEEK
ncbi:uncharacterized protein LOC143026574 isoform X2 [Oratosquilla oratoria]|uniref:uncharacterized protein LOC143026574 isoform X2 n=1 Tax=Oratosquilla oratoria TaxID=337810 RepID=UPI003F76CC71